MAEKTYNQFSELMNSLIERIPVQDLDGDALKIFDEHRDTFWDGLLHYLQNEDVQTPFNGMYGIRQNMFPKETSTSVVEYINDNADLISTFLDDYMPEYGQPRPNHWNKSFETLMLKYIEYYNNPDYSPSINSPTIKEMKEANAGNSFLQGDRYVVPWKNILQQSYVEVRGNDKIDRVLSDKSLLQFTHESFKKYIRLLMPEYQRIVQIEDLNRNFWVIGQLIVGILNYLFSEDSPFKTMADGIADEIAQLWQNVLFLWAGVAILSQEENNKRVMKIIVPINNDELRPYVKFDGFSFTEAKSDDLLKKLWEGRLKYLTDLYDDCSLIVIPEVRGSSYERNYYAESFYPGIIVYNKNLTKGISDYEQNDASDESIENIDKNKLNFYRFKVLESNDEGTAHNFILNLIGNTVADNVPLPDLQHVYIRSPQYYFINNEKDQTRVENAVYYRGVRPTFDIEYAFDENAISKLDVTIFLQDVAYCLSTEDIPFGFINFKLNGDALEGELEAEHKTGVKTAKTIDRGIYFGEFPSFYSVAESKFQITISKSWKGINESAKKNKQNAIISVKGVDSLGFVHEPIGDITFNCPDKDTSQAMQQKIELEAYSPSGEPYVYTIEEKPFSVLDWKITPAGRQYFINVKSSSKTAAFTNTWTRIDYETDVTILNFNYYDQQSESEKFGTRTYANETAFLNALPGNVEKQDWKDRVDEHLSTHPVKLHSARLYGARYGYQISNGSGSFKSIFEVCPYLTIVTYRDEDKGYEKYHFQYVLNQTTSASSTLLNGKFPYVSSNTTDAIGIASTQYLYRYPDFHLNPGRQSWNQEYVYADDPAVPVQSGYAPYGNIRYGTRASKDGIKLFFDNDGALYLHNFILFVEDRARAGATYVKELYPYYYKCSISQTGSGATFGLIDAQLVITNVDKRSLIPTGQLFTWPRPNNKTTVRPYLNYDNEDQYNPSIDQQAAQSAMGAFETDFLSNYRRVVAEVT